jgi:hypothetical protein
MLRGEEGTVTGANVGSLECRLLSDIALNVPTFSDVISETYEGCARSFVSHSRVMFQMWIPDLSRVGTGTAFRDQRGSC